MSLPIGSKVGPYEIVAPIGAGGMGEVFRACDMKLGRDVRNTVVGSRLSVVRVEHQRAGRRGQSF